MHIGDFSNAKLFAGLSTYKVYQYEGSVDAPEVIELSNRDIGNFDPFPFDIFCFGILLCELLTNDPNSYKNISNFEDNMFYSIIAGALATQPTRRRSSNQILQSLDNLQD